MSRWFGFGISYQNPVEEADFLRTHLSAYRLGNDYSSGGYLLWALWPKMKIMIDPRQFPFKGWIDRYGAFQSGRNIKGFVQDFPCEVWCVRYRSRPVIEWFVRSPDWRIAFYGPSAVVFARKEVPGLERNPQAGEGIGRIKNMGQAQLVLQFAASIRDWDRARTVLAGMRERFRCPGEKSKIQAASDWLDRRIENSRRQGREGSG